MLLSGAAPSMKLEAAMPDPSLERCSTCFFPTEFHKVPLIGVKPYNHDSKMFTFGLPEDVSLDLPVCACLLVEGFDEEGEQAVRPYTPTSPNEQKGSFDLMVKIYEKGVVSQWLNNLPIGAQVGFKHIPFNIKSQYPFAGKKKINMICGGTGITPMYQALHKIVNTPGDVLQVVLLCGSRTPQDILLRKELESLVERSRTWYAPPRVKVVHVVGDSPDQALIEDWKGELGWGWQGELGWVDEAKVIKHAFPPAPDVLTLVCGVPSLYEAMCGPRTEEEVKEGSILARLGYSKDMVGKM